MNETMDDAEQIAHTIVQGQNIDRMERVGSTRPVQQVDDKKPRPFWGRPQGVAMSDADRPVFQAAWLDVYGQIGVIQTACTMVGISRTTVERWRKDEAFQEMFRVATDQANDIIRHAIYRRAVVGVKKMKPVIYKGEIVDEVEVTEYSDLLLIFLAKSRMPEFRDKLDLTANVQPMKQYVSVDLDAV